MDRGTRYSIFEMRIAVGIEYDGSAYHGWQRQNDNQSIQETLEKALSSVADRELKTICAGRTDAGVHALEQIAHFDVDIVREIRAWVLGTNANLPDDIRVVWAKQVANEFHARYSAIARFYRYVIRNRCVRSALCPTHETWVYHPLDIMMMQDACRYLIGVHDFSSFRSQQCQSKSPIRRLYSLAVKGHGDRLTITVVANAFLHHMIRNIAGVLIRIGLGKEPPEWMQWVLSARDRNCADVTASPHGLYLAGVYYPRRYDLPTHQIFSRLPDDAKRYDE